MTPMHLHVSLLPPDDGPLFTCTLSCGPGYLIGEIPGLLGFTCMTGGEVAALAWRLPADDGRVKRAELPLEGVAS